jgi:L-ascorbate oxidase
MFLKENFLVTARTAYDDFIGEFVMHCHILDHEDQGMMQNVTIVSSDDQASPAPLKSHRRPNH